MLRSVRAKAISGYVSVAIALAFLLAGCGGGSPPPSPTATIIGYVVDQAGGSAVEGTTVVLQEMGAPSTPLTTTTGNEGRFQFSNLPPAPADRHVRWYQLVISQPQWATVKMEVPVWQAETVRLTLVQQRRDPAFASDTQPPTLTAQGHTGDPSKWDITASDEAGGSGLRLVGWLMDYDWGHVEAQPLNGVSSYSATIYTPALWEQSSGEHVTMFVAVDRAGNMTIDSVGHSPADNPPQLLDTAPTMVGAVASTITNSFLELPPVLPAATTALLGSSATQVFSTSTPNLLQWVARTARQAGKDAGKQPRRQANSLSSPTGSQPVQPSALPPGSEAVLFTTVGWRQASLIGVTGFRLYRNGRFAFDHQKTTPNESPDIYRTDDFGAELVPGQTTTYAVSAFGYGRESALSASRSVVPLAVLNRPAAVSPADGTVLTSLPTLQWTSVPGQAVSYVVEILAPGMQESEFWEVTGTALPLNMAEPPSGYTSWPAGTYAWRPLAARSAPNLGTLFRPWYEYQAVTLAAGSWRTFTYSPVP
ncbi:MAG: carboxypeptidase regulatory-like domain-containing protein [Limnochordales bacterium]|nr:carboxypeptidase regulatory-like domain-containing protein [Limnochordales bacterium]